MENIKYFHFDKDVERYIIFKSKNPIGVISFTKYNELSAINDLTLLPEYSELKNTIVEFIENNFKYFNCPFYPM